MVAISGSDFKAEVEISETAVAVTEDLASPQV